MRALSLHSLRMQMRKAMVAGLLQALPAPAPSAQESLRRLFFAAYLAPRRRIMHVSYHRLHRRLYGFRTVEQMLARHWWPPLPFVRLTHPYLQV